MQPWMVWIKKHPLHAARTALVVLFYTLVGAAGGFFLAFGPFSRDAPGSAPFAILGGLAAGGYWLRQQVLVVRQQHRPARRMRRFFLAGLFLAGLAVGGLVLAQSILFGQLRLPNSDRAAASLRLFRAMQVAYPYFEEKGIDWRALYLEHRPGLENAAGRENYYQALAGWLVQLGDAHTGIQEPFLFNCCFGFVEEIEGLPVVRSVEPSAREAGLQPGSVILRLGGQPAEAILNQPSPWVSGSLNPRQARYRAFASLLSIPEDGTLQVDILDPRGQEKSLLLVQSTASPEAATPNPAVAWQRLPSGTGYIRVRRLWNQSGEDLVADFDAALDQLSDAPGIILDLRGNGGGNSLYGDAIAGRFLAQPFKYGYELYPARLYLRLWKGRVDYIARPRAPQYPGRLAILINPGSVSSAEQLIAALSDSGRAVLVGRGSGGSSGNPILFKMPDGAVRFSTGAFYRATGQLVEWHGFSPDIPVSWSRADLLAGLDPDIAAAERWILENSAP